MVPPIFYRRVMGKIYYIVEAYIGSMAQGTDLALVKARDGEIYGCSFEFDLCTREIGPFCPNSDSYSKVVWSDYTDEVGVIPASWEEIESAGLSKYVVGYSLESSLDVHRFNGR